MNPKKNSSISCFIMLIIVCLMACASKIRSSTAEYPDNTSIDSIQDTLTLSGEFIFIDSTKIRNIAYHQAMSLPYRGLFVLSGEPIDCKNAIVVSVGDLKNIGIGKRSYVIVKTPIQDNVQRPSGKVLPCFEAILNEGQTCRFRLIRQID